MTVKDLFQHSKNLALVALAVAVVSLLAVLLLVPGRYYVRDAGAITVYVRGLGGPVELRCPRFSISVHDMVLTDHYMGRKTVVQGTFVYEKPRGLRTVGPVKISIPPDGDSQYTVVTVESRDHPIVPLAFVHGAVTTMRKIVEVNGRKLNIDVVWEGAIDAAAPPLKSVHCDGQPIPSRLTALGLI